MNIEIILSLLDGVSAPLKKIADMMSGITQASGAASGEMSGVSKTTKALDDAVDKVVGSVKKAESASKTATAAVASGLNNTAAAAAMCVKHIDGIGVVAVNTFGQTADKTRHAAGMVHQYGDAIGSAASAVTMMGKASATAAGKAASGFKEAKNGADNLKVATTGINENIKNTDKSSQHWFNQGIAMGQRYENALISVNHQVTASADATVSAVDKQKKRYDDFIETIQELKKAYREASKESKFAGLKEPSMGAMRIGAGVTAAGAGLLGAVAVPVVKAAERQAALSDMKRSTMLADGSNPAWDAINPTIQLLKSGRSKSDLDISEIAGGMLNEGLDAKALNAGALKAALNIATVGKLDNRAAGEGFAGLVQASGVDDYDALGEIIQRMAHGSNIGMDAAMSQLSGLMLKGQERGITGKGATQGFAKIITGLSMSGMDKGAIAPAIESMMGGVQSLGDKFKHGSGWRTEEIAGIQKKYGLGNFTSQLFDKGGNLKGADGGEKLNNIVQMIDSVGKKFGDNVQDKLKLFKALFGEGVAEMMMKLDFGMLNEAHEKMRTQADLTTKAADVNDLLATKWEGLSNKVSEFTGGSGSVLSQQLGVVVDCVSGIVEGLTNWTAAHPNLTAGILGVVAVLGGLLVVGGGVITILGSLGQSLFWITNISATAGPAFTALKAGFLSATSGVWSFTASLFACPITWIVLAIVALAGAAYLIYEYWEPISNWFANLWDGIKELFAGLWDWFKSLWDEIPGWMQWFMPFINIPMLIIENWDSVKAFFGVLWDGLVAMWDTVSGWCVKFWEFLDIPGKIKADWNNLKAVFAFLWTWLKAKWDETVKWLDILFPFLNIPERIQKAWQKLKDFFGLFGKFFKRVFKGAADDATAGAKAVTDAADKAVSKDNKASNVLKKAEEPAKKVAATTKAVTPKETKNSDADSAKAPDVTAALKQANKGGAKTGGNITINYEPKFEFKGDVKDEDKNWFKKQLEQHKYDLAMMVREIAKENSQWMGAS